MHHQALPPSVALGFLHNLEEKGRVWSSPFFKLTYFLVEGEGGVPCSIGMSLGQVLNSL